jgi:transposase InsO family protein
MPLRNSDIGTSRTRSAISREGRLLGRLISVDEPSPVALHRFAVVRWYEAHGRVVRLTARHFGYSPDTVSRWVRAFAQGQLAGLEDRSRRPTRVRTPLTPSAVVIRIRELRERYPRWGREKLRVLLEREHIAVSAKTIDRVLARLRARGELREPIVLRKAARARARAIARVRRPRDLVVDRPGALAQIDSKELRFGERRLYVLAAVDCFTRKRVVAVVPRLSSDHGAAFLTVVGQTFPFAVTAIQTDGGHEFQGAFGPAAAAAGITHYVNRPNYPQGNGRIERTFLTDEQECFEVEEVSSVESELRRTVVAWNAVYEDVRPHEALGYLTPNEFYARWRTQHPDPTAVVSDIP